MTSSHDQKSDCSHSSEEQKKKPVSFVLLWTSETRKSRQEYCCTTSEPSFWKCHGSVCSGVGTEATEAVVLPELFVTADTPTRVLVCHQLLQKKNMEELHGEDGDKQAEIWWKVPAQVRRKLSQEQHWSATASSKGPNTQSWIMIFVAFLILIFNTEVGQRHGNLPWMSVQNMKWTFGCDPDRDAHVFNKRLLQELHVALTQTATGF